MLTEEQKKQYLDYNCEDIAKFTELLVQDKSRLNYISWQDIADLVYDKFGVAHSRHWYSRNYDDKLSAYRSTDYSANRDPQDDFQDKLLELQKAKAKIADERNQNRAYIRRLAREETIKEIALEAVKAIGSKKLLPDYSDIIHTTSNDREAILLLSDWHYGLDFDMYWNRFNPEIARERVFNLLTETIRYCRDQNVDRVHVLNLADLIAGRIHLTIRLESRIDVITQIMEVSEILAEFLTALSQYFQVDYYSCTDNHSRLEPDKTQSLDLESLCRITDWYLTERIGKNINIHKNEFSDDIITLNVLGHNIGGIHGHLDRPSKAIEDITLLTRRPYDLICMAHLHHFSMDEKNTCRIVCNGSLMGSDSYAKNLRLHSKPSQTIITITKERACENIHIIELN